MLFFNLFEWFRKEREIDCNRCNTIVFDGQQCLPVCSAGIHSWVRVRPRSSCSTERIDHKNITASWSQYWTYRNLQTPVAERMRDRLVKLSKAMSSNLKPIQSTTVKKEAITDSCFWNHRRASGKLQVGSWGGKTYGSLKDLRISLYLLKFLYDMPNQQTYWLHIPSIFLCQSSWITWKSHQVGWCMSSQAACCVQQCWFCCCEVGRKKWPMMAG